MTVINTIGNQINFTKATSIFVPTTAGNTDLTVITALMAELSTLGYTLSPALVRRLQSTDISVVTKVYTFLVESTKHAVGADVTHKSLFGNFPLNLSHDMQHYLNSISYAATSLGLEFKCDCFGTDTELDYTTTLKIINLASETKSFELFSNMCSSTVSLSVDDKEYIRGFIKEHGIKCLNHIPSEVSSKENMSIVMVSLFRNTKITKSFFNKFLKTPTDILRVACELSGGDCTLKERTKFKMPNSERKFIMEALDNLENPQEDMLRHKSSWIKLAECLHTGAFKNRYKNTFKAVQDLRENVKIETFNSKVEALILSVLAGEVNASKSLTQLLSTRPGEFARKLDFLLANSQALIVSEIIDSFSQVVDDVATTVLLKLRSHLDTRDSSLEYRYFIPKGNCGRVKVFDGDLRNPITVEYINSVQEIISTSLQKRFSDRGDLGTVFIHNNIYKALVPLVQRDTISGTNTLSRGSRVSLDEGSKFIRPFIYWKDKSDECIDVDLSAVGYDDQWNYIDDLAYYNQQSFGATHSGDFTSAPNGASEFLDINIEKAVSAGMRYLTVVVNVFTGQGFNEFQCFSGFQERQNPSGKNFEATTVKNRYDIVGATNFNVPLIIDLVQREMIWCDLALNGGTFNNVSTEATGVLALSKICNDMIKFNPNCGALLNDHKSRFSEVYYGNDDDLSKLEQDGIIFDNVYDLGFCTDFNKISAEFL